MAGVQTRRKPAADKLLAAVKQLSAAELRAFEEQFATWRGQNGENRGRQSDEMNLLATIRRNSNLPDSQQRRFERLRRKRQAERLNKREEKELQGLWQRVESMNVARLGALMELARRRGTDVKTLMRELGLVSKSCLRDLQIFALAPPP
jgi:hypothetical protein